MHAVVCMLSASPPRALASRRSWSTQAKYTRPGFAAMPGRERSAQFLVWHEWDTYRAGMHINSIDLGPAKCPCIVLCTVLPAFHLATPRGCSVMPERTHIARVFTNFKAVAFNSTGPGFHKFLRCEKILGAKDATLKQLPSLKAIRCLC